MLPKGSAEVNEKYEQDIPLNWARRAGRPAKQKPATEPALPSIPRVTRLIALAIKFQEMVDRGEVRDYADLARLGFVTRARLTQIMNLLLLDPKIQEQILFSERDAGCQITERRIRSAVVNVCWLDQERALTSCLPGKA
jgi:hypothetical protein